MTLPFPAYTIDAAEAFERGVQYGTIAREQIAVSIETYRRFFLDFVGVDWATAKRLGDGYAPAIGAFDSDLLKEIRGIADGSGFGTSEILALNARSEIGLGSGMLDGCTAVAAFGPATVAGATLLCQNWDWRASQLDAFVLLSIERPGKPRIAMLTEAGIIGKIGFNEFGLGVCLNAIVTDELRPGGTPLHVVLRGILESRNLGDAVGRVALSSLASAANFLLAQPGVGSLDIEAAPSRLDVLLPERGVLIHTNHLLSVRLAQLNDLAAAVFPDSYPRLGRAEQLVQEWPGPLDLGAMQELLRDHGNAPDSICKHEDEIGDAPGRRLATVCSIAMDLSAHELLVTHGPPCLTSYTRTRPLAAAALQAG